MQMNFNSSSQEHISKAILVGIVTRENSAEEVEKELDELARLLDTAGGEELARLVQNKDTPDPRTMIGSGKIAELSELCKNNGVKLVIFDAELSPSQIRNIEDDIGDDVRCIDRSMLILDIFALHATTGEGKLQVELAQLKYTAPRLIGKGTELSRLGGGIGTRGPGESKLESDRRHMKRRITALEEELRELEKNRMTMRASRDRSQIPQIAIVGYTNAGKSTLLNTLTDAGILAENKLFATLDPTTRKLKLPSGESVLLTDTVGFIAKLPPHLVKAFHATVEELEYADLLLHVIDASDENRQAHIAVVDSLIAQLAKPGTPVLQCYNKADLVEMTDIPVGEDVVAISAKSGMGMEQLLQAIEKALGHSRHHIVVTLPYSMGGMVETLHSNAQVLNVDYTAEGIAVETIVDDILYGRLRDYITEET